MPRIDEEALALLRQLTGEAGAQFRPHQLEAIQNEESRSPEQAALV